MSGWNRTPSSLVNTATASGRRVVKDSHAVGMATVAEVLIKSSNIGMTQIGWKMGIPTLYEGVTRFGFGKRTGVELPGDQGGVGDFGGES